MKRLGKALIQRLREILYLLLSLPISIFLLRPGDEPMNAIAERN